MEEGIVIPQSLGLIILNSVLLVINLQNETVFHIVFVIFIILVFIGFGIGMYDIWKDDSKTGGNE